MSEAEQKIRDLIGAIALAEDAAQSAEDHENLSKAWKIRKQIRTMEAELRALQDAGA